MANLSEEPTIDPTAEVVECRLGRYTEVGARTLIGESELGDYSYVVNDAEVIYTSIGKFCSIASHTRINPGNHPTWRASQAHFTYRASRYFEGEADDEAFFGWRRSQPVTIGHDVWIGHGAVVMPGVRIGDGAVVGASAVVTRDVEPYTIAAGVPARALKRRFAPEIGERLRALAWWDWSHARLRRALPDFRTLAIEAFLERYEGEAASSSDTGEHSTRS